MKQRNRTRLMTALLVLALCLGPLTGCGASTQPDPDGQTQTPAGSDSSMSQDTPPADTDGGASQGTSPEEIPPQTSGGNTDGSGTAVSALPDDFPMELTFSSGAGGWRTLLTLQPDGSFTGQYSDWDSGGDPSQYPNGIYDICNFSGTFKDLRQLDKATYVMTLDTLTAQETEGAEWTEDGILYIGATPYGLEGGSEFRLYAPTSSTDSLPEVVLIQWPQWSLPETVPEGELGCWALYNAEEFPCFFSYN